MANPKDWTPEDSRRKAAEELEAMRRQDAYRLAHLEFTKKAASQALASALAPQPESCGEAVPGTMTEQTMVERVTGAIRDAGGEMNNYSAMARAAIEAMREPTGTMRGAYETYILDGFEAAYNAMIDAALKE